MAEHASVTRLAGAEEESGYEETGWDRV